jgi:hypothetical protein
MKLRLVVEIEMTAEQMADYSYEYGQGESLAEVKADVSEQVNTALTSGTLAEYATIHVSRSR